MSLRDTINQRHLRANNISIYALRKAVDEVRSETAGGLWEEIPPVDSSMSTEKLRKVVNELMALPCIDDKLDGGCISFYLLKGGLSGTLTAKTTLAKESVTEFFNKGLSQAIHGSSLDLGYYSTDPSKYWICKVKYSESSQKWVVANMRVPNMKRGDTEELIAKVAKKLNVSPSYSIGLAIKRYL